MGIDTLLDAEKRKKMQENPAAATNIVPFSDASFSRDTDIVRAPEVASVDPLVEARRSLLVGTTADQIRGVKFLDNGDPLIIRSGVSGVELDLVDALTGEKTTYSCKNPSDCPKKLLGHLRDFNKEHSLGLVTLDQEAEPERLKKAKAA